MNPIPWQKSTGTQLLIQRLAEAGVGETVSYAELTKAAGSDVRTSGRAVGWLRTARAALEKSKSITFLTIPNVGLRRASSPEIVNEADRHRKGVSRKIRRALRTTLCADRAELTAQQANRFDAQVSVLGAAMVATSVAGLRRIEAQVVKQNRRLDHKPALDALRTIGGLRR